MSWLTVLWSIACAVCGTLAAIHWALWLARRRTEPGHLFFTVAAAGAGVNAMAELAMMRATTVEAYALGLRGAIAASAVMIIGMVWYARTYLRLGRPELAWGLTGIWSGVIALCVLLPYGPSFDAIQSLHVQPAIWGETFAVARGTTGRWSLLLTFGDLLIAVFVLGAAVEAARRGQRQRAGWIGLLAGLVVAATIHARLVDAGKLNTPYLVSFVFFGIIVFAGYPLSADVVRVAELAGRLAASEAHLRANSDRLRLAAEAASLTFWTFDAERNDVAMDAAARLRCGIALGETVTLARFLACVHPDDRALVERLVRRALAEGGELEGEGRLLAPAGETLWIALRGAGPPGGPLRGVALDITERKHAEIAAEEQRQEIAHLGRLGVLSHLARSVAHELNQPLTAILNNAHVASSLLEQDPIDRHELRQILGEIQEDDKRAAGVIWRLHGLLSRRAPNRESIDLNAVVDETSAIVRTDLANRRVQLETRLAPTLPPVHADRLQIQQLLLSLILNGCEAMGATPPAERRLLVQTQAIDSTGVRVTVSDRGTGIASDAADRVFEPFYTSRADRVGLGLTISRAVVESHGGTISVAPHEGPGATFQVDLPSAH